MRIFFEKNEKELSTYGKLKGLDASEAFLSGTSTFGIRIYRQLVDNRMSQLWHGIQGLSSLRFYISKAQPSGILYILSLGLYGSSLTIMLFIQDLEMCVMAEQCVIVQYLLELSKSLNALATNTNMIKNFFKKYQFDE